MTAAAVRQNGPMTTAGAPSTSEVRTWAREQGLPVGDRGRLSPDLVAAYSSAHGEGVERQDAPAHQHAPRPSISRTVKAKARWNA